MIALIVESAGRSLLLLATILAMLQLLRIRSEGIQTAAWRIGLSVALLMPVLMQLRVVSIPMDAEMSTVLSAVAARADEASSGSWFGVLTFVYALIAGVFVAKLAMGLLASWRLHRNAKPVHGEPLAGQSVRISSAINVPVAVGSTVLLPADFSTWKPHTLRAVLSHEGEHARNGDFYWHVAALLHRAIFWINPLAWWLPKRIAELAEARADRTAARVVGDPVEYAQMLLDFSRRPAPASLTVAMARSADVHHRVEQLLRNDVGSNTSTGQARLFVSTSTIAIAAILACASCERQTNKGGQIASTPASQPAPMVSQPSEQKDVIVKPKVSAERRITKPPYDAATRRAGHEGTVYVKILVDVDGRVAEVKLEKSSGHEALDNAVLSEARANWRLHPGTINGEPKVMWVTVPIVFKLTDKQAEPTA